MKFILETLVIIIALYLGVSAFFFVCTSIGSVIGVMPSMSVEQAIIAVKLIAVPSAFAGVLLSVFG